MDAIHMPSAMTLNCTARWTRLECRAWFDELLGRATAGKTLIGVIAANASTVPREQLDTALRIMATLKARAASIYMMYMHTRKIPTRRH